MMLKDFALKCTNHEGWGPWSDIRDPDFTLCFEESISIVPDLLLILIGIPLIIHTARNVSSVHTSPKLHFILKMVFSLLLVVNSMIYFGVKNADSSKDWVLDIGILSSFIHTISMVIATLASLYYHKSAYYSSTLLLLYWPVSIFFQLVQVRTLLLIDSSNVRSVEFLLYFMTLVLSIFMFFIESYPKQETSDYQSLDDEQEDSPEDKANVYSFLTFSWMSGLLALGYKKHIVAEDLWSLPKSYQVGVVSEKFNEVWEHEKKSKLDPSLTKSLLFAFGGPFAFAGLLKALQDVLGFTQPALLKRLIGFIHSFLPGSEVSMPLYYGVGISVAMLLTAVTQTMFLHQYFQLTMVTGMKLRSALVTAIYQKALKLSSASGQTSTVGEIVNHMSVDTQRIQDLCNYGHVVWSGVFQIVLALVLLYQQLGVSVFAGFSLMVLAIPFNVFIGSRLRKLQQSNLKNKDSRIKLIDELLNGIKVIKLYAWEKSFLSKLFHVRNDLELETLRKYALLNATSTFTSFSLPQLVSLFTFATYSLISDKPLTSETVFVSLSLLNLLGFPLNMLPYVLTSTVEAAVSIGRIHKFLTTEELDPTAVKQLPRSADPNAPAIEVQNASFSWVSLSMQPVIDDLSVKVNTGELFAIVGRVGSGKSSFISAILGDMNKLSGEVIVRGRIAYVPQQPWIMNATVRDNITFGHRYDPEFYEETIRVCALEQDLDMLISGDLTEIGERGINLSGGQKARISLARAVYARADVYLLDDPLSAVDAHVGKHIFDKAIGNNGILRTKTRVLVTHAIHFLPFTDRIAMFQNGMISEVGAYDDLSADENSEIHNLIAAKAKEPQETEANEQEIINQLSKSMGSHSLTSHDEDLPDLKDADDSATIRRHTSRVSYVSLRPPSVMSIRKRGNRQNRSNIVDESKPSRQMTVEESAQGSVSSNVYWAYFKACSYSGIIMWLILTILSQSSVMAGNLWLKKWSDDDSVDNVTFNIAIYGILGIVTAVVTFFQYIVLFLACGLRAAKATHNSMLMSVVRAPMSFFDTTPLGRIVNRFSKDQSTIDETLPRSFGQYVGTFIRVLFVVGIIAFSNPPFLVMVVFLGFLYFYIQRYYLQTSRELKRLDSVSRSPIYAHFQETLGGASSIRAYRQQFRFIGENEERLDTNLRAYYPSMSLNRWLAVRLEFLGSIIIFSSALLPVLSLGYGIKVDPGLVGLSMTYALNVTQSLNWCIRMYCEIETNIVSMERIKEYIELPSEAPYDASIPQDVSFDLTQTNIPMNTYEDSLTVSAAPDHWPNQGEVEFKDYSTRYRSGLDLVLKGISLKIQPKEKVGIVGRTGAGKSSLTLALFRIIEAVSGSITIDGQDISKLSLHDLRSRLSIIPQDPVLFAGMVRDNLDPFGTLPDADLWKALEHANLKDHILGMDGQLDAIVSQGGENFSVGQRQLICMARALLRNSSVLVLDEATAAIDIQTDNLIQKTIREAFSHCTVLTIAHRINTVIDGDKILVLEQGRVAEFDSPQNLLDRKNKSLFYSLAKEAGLA